MFFKIIKNKIVLSIIVVTILLLAFLSILIPKVTENNILNLVTNNSKTIVEQIKLTRAYYTKEIVGDIKAFAPNIKFDYDHAGIDGKIAFPTSLVHELSDIYSKNTGTTIRLYSEFPFKPKADRILSDIQKEALKYVEKNEQGIWIKRDKIDGKEVLRVAVADYMSQEACVKCHNSHKDKTWQEGKWKLGDKRGVLEVITPLDKTLEENENMKYKILLSIFISMLLLVIFYSISLVRREKELTDINEGLETVVDEQTKEIKKNLEIMGKYIIYSKTDPKGIITEVSDAFCNISQYSKEELLGKSHNIVRDPDMPKTVFQDLWSTIQNGQIWQGEIRNKKKDGTYYWISSTITPELDDDNNLVGYIAVRQDITSEKELESNSKKLYEAEKLASLGEMIGNIAHQWRQPLSAISSSASSIKIENEIGVLTKEDIDKRMDLIVNKTNFLSETINTFRNFLKTDKVYKSIVLEEEINNSISVIESTLKNNNIEFVNNISKNSKNKIEIVSGELPQVLVNIFNNAKDVLLEKEVNNPWIELNIDKNDKNIIISIEDNGGGIPENILPRIFEPYFTTKHQSQGTGLGLHMSYKIITESLKGKLYVHNTDNGAKFFIELPLNK